MATAVHPEVKALFDELAGKTHSDDGEIMAGLARILALHDQIRDQAIWADRHRSWERVVELENELAQLPRCGKAPSEFTRALGFDAACDLHAGHSGGCKHGKTKSGGADDERAEAMRWRDTGTLDAIDRAAEAEAELADLTAPTGWGHPGVEWAYARRGSGVIWPMPEPMGDPEIMRQTLEQQQGADGVVILRRECTAWHEVEGEES